MLSESEQRQCAYYDRIAKTYDQHFANPYALQYRYQVFQDFLGELSFKEQRVLDAMCGGGENSGFFLQQGANVTGIDISRQQCELYKKRYPNATCLCSSILNTGLPDGSFDFVITESLHHLPPKIDEGVYELSRLLRPGGILMIWEPATGSLLDLARKIWYRLDRRFFEENESAIAVEELAHRHAGQLQLNRLEYGGNVAHLFVQSSMQFRIPLSWLPRYAPFLIRLEPRIQKLQGRRTACWAAVLFKKI
ncbi:MAG: class I SAM-dependent methyltransferase [Candidatus Electrothrix sp. LOE1_4_5]|nr:class I SAM-dependent methyltransferase [Candidatus Electrothrix gigas]MCI5225598.1 class I SAM-dependent methyltransferase [Candidatus Electrothrix gigas]